MTEREQAISIAKQILNGRSNDQWCEPLAREFLHLAQVFDGRFPKGVTFEDHSVKPALILTNEQCKKFIVAMGEARIPKGATR